MKIKKLPKTVFKFHFETFNCIGWKQTNKNQKEPTEVIFAKQNKSI